MAAAVTHTRLAARRERSSRSANMRDELQRVLDLQAAWSRPNTPEMAERGRLVRHDATGWLNDNADDLSAAVGTPVEASSRSDVTEPGLRRVSRRRGSARGNG